MSRPLKPIHRLDWRMGVETKWNQRNPHIFNQLDLKVNNLSTHILTTWSPFGLDGYEKAYCHGILVAMCFLDPSFGSALWFSTRKPW